MKQTLTISKGQKMKRYKDIKAGQRFHRGKAKCCAPRLGKLYWEVYIRKSGSLCECVERHNYGNNDIGGLYAISANSPVFIVG